MIRAARFTLDGYFNYGNVLQNYALNAFLRNHGFSVDTIWHTPQKLLENQCHKWGFRDFKHVFTRRHFRAKLRNGSYQWDIIRQAYMKRFCDEYVGVRYDISLSEIEAEYDYVLIGSDQVWNPEFETNDIAFLQFAAPEKRIAYAASFGMPAIPEQHKSRFAAAIYDMAHVSVREEQGARIVKELTGREVPVVLDPTLLLTAEEWEQIELKPAWYTQTEEEKYVLTYFLGQRPNIVESIADRKGLRCIHLLDNTVFNHYTVSPQEFIYLFHHASLVYTDSFHGTVFSILFQRPFVVCDRIEKRAYSMNSRIDTLLKLCRIKGRRGIADYHYEIPHVWDMEYPDLENILHTERTRSSQFLFEAMK